MFKIFLFLFSPLTLFSITFTVASYNVENLFDMKKDGTEYKEYIPYEHNWTKKTFRKKLMNISEVICEINADIMGLQEIENENVLKKLQKTLIETGCSYPYIRITHQEGSSIQQAILSKFPIEGSQEILVGSQLGLRPILKVTYRINGHLLYIYVNHWKSKRSTERFRLRSAKALTKELNQLPKQSEYILLGDFNSNYNESQLIHSRSGINSILNTSNSENRLYREEDLRENTFQHYNLWMELPTYKRWSHNFYGKKQGLDAIMLPQTLFDGVGIDYVDNSFGVLKKKYLFHKKGYILRWEYRHQHHTGKGYSDHLPIVATFSTDSYTKEDNFTQWLSHIKIVRREKDKVWLLKENGTEEMIFRGVNALQVGHYYDLKIYQEQYYQGIKEIVDFEIEKSYDNAKN